MKTVILFLVCLSAATVMPAQDPLSRDEALKRLYSQYDVEKGTAQWACTQSQEQKPLHEGWPCRMEYATVSVEVLLMAEVGEGNMEKIYLAASAKPASYPDDYGCHACAPAIGVGVFAWRAQHWVLESANAAVGFYGGWGSPPEIDFVQIGPEKHGLVLSVDDEGQGYSSSNKILLTSLGRTVSEVWSIEDGQDDFGAYDPTDKFAPHLSYRSSAAIKFYAVHSDGGGLTDYYDIEVISRGNRSKDNHHLKSENWAEIYRFRDGQYKLLQHRDFIEVKKFSNRVPR